MNERAPTASPDDTEQRLRDIEGKLAALIGYNGVPGWVPRIESEQARSAASQGQRLEELKTSVASRLATLEGDLSAVEQALSTTREATIDTRARLAAAVAVIIALISAAGVVAKILT